MSLPSASGLPRAMACAASQVLPTVGHESEKAEDGTDRHGLLAPAIAAGDPAAVEVDEPRHRAWLDEVWEDAAPLLGMASEVSFGLDVGGGEPKGLLLGANLGRKYPPVNDSTFVGTADYYRPDLEANRVVVVDLKTGAMDVPHPKRNHQLRMLAVAAALWEGVGEATVGILQAPEGRRAWWRWHHMDALEMAEATEQLVRLRHDILQARVVVAAGMSDRLKLVVGDHCTYCPARLGCPAQVGLAQRLASEPEALVYELQHALSPESAGLVLQRVRAIRAVLKSVDAALFAYASAEGGIHLPDGRVWKQTDKVRTELDGLKVLSVLNALHGPEVAHAGVEVKATKTGLERALTPVWEARKAAGERVTKKSLVEQALAALRDVGGVGEVLSSNWEDCEP